MEIEEALTAHLLAQPGLTALIERRLFFRKRTSPLLPAVVRINVSDVKDHTHDGQSPLESPMIQYTAYADSEAGAKAVGNQLKAALSDYTGTMSGIAVQYIKLVNELASSEESTDGTTEVYTLDLEFEINFIKE